MDRPHPGCARPGWGWAPTVDLPQAFAELEDGLRT